MNKRRIALYLAGVILSIALAFLFPSNVGKAQEITDLRFNNESTLISQTVEAISLTPKEVTRIYRGANLVGVLSSSEKVEEAIAAEQQRLAAAHNGTIYSVRLSDEIYLITENSLWVYENKDDEIIAYLNDNDLLVVDATRIDIVRDDEIKDTIYVNSTADFSKALRHFAMNFIDEGTFEILESGGTISALTTYGTQDVSVRVEETLKATASGAAVENIFSTEEEIFEYLCYGRDYELTYYTVEQFDTVAGAANKNGLTSKQLMSLNPQITSIDQALVAGEKLNVTYFNSPITVITEMQSFVKEVTYPEAPVYIRDDSIAAGTVIEKTAPVNGYNDTLYTEVYVNGVLSGYRQESSTVVEPTVQGVYLVGAGGGTYKGTMSFILPCANPCISCDYYGYAGHTGCDFINIYDRYGDVYAVVSGTITTNMYNGGCGWMYIIDAGYDADGNHFRVRYCHFNVAGFFPVGTEVTRGMVIAQIGNTGRSTGPHVHVSIYVNGQQVDPCIYLPCELARRL